jgi:hypothetical protein
VSKLAQRRAVAAFLPFTGYPEMKTMVLLCVAITSATAVMAGDAEDAIAKCATLKDAKARVACYDKIGTGVKGASGKDAYVSMSLSDLKTDIKSLRGKKIAVEASVQTMGEMHMLKDGPMDMAAVFAEMDKLPRQDRKKLVDGCQFILCSGVFYGTVKLLPLGMGLDVERITWD